MGGTLVVSRAEKLFPEWMEILEGIGFPDVEFTQCEAGGLAALIKKMRPDIVIIGSRFYGLSTPYMVLEMLRDFPRLNVAVVNRQDFPDELGMSFIANGARSYVNMMEGMKELYRGLKIVRDGGVFISEGVMKCIAMMEEYPKPGKLLTAREAEILKLSCRGLTEEQMGKRLRISRGTVIKHRMRIYSAMNVHNGVQLIKAALQTGKIREAELDDWSGELTVKNKPGKTGKAKCVAGA